MMAISVNRLFRLLPQVVLLVICYFFLIACQPESSFQRDRDVWVMRSVLDDKIRMITLALHKDCYATYNAENCALDKIWRGGVHWDGVAFNNVKSLQPESWGDVYWRPSSDKPWKILQDGQLTTVEPQFKGYFIQNNQITFQYELIMTEDTRVRIYEQPEFLPFQNGKVGFQRKFRTVGVPSKLNIWNGNIQLPNNGEQIFTDYFVPLPLADANGQSSKPRVNELSLLDRHGCLTCHEIDQQTIGPSFRQLAAKYGDIADDGEKLRPVVRRVIRGGSGVWGDVPMIPHPNIKGDVIRGMVVQMLRYEPSEEDVASLSELVIDSDTGKIHTKPGFGEPLEGVHPSLSLQTIRPSWFKPRVGGIDFLSDGRLLVSTWDSLGAVYLVEGVMSGDVSQIEVKRIATGLAEPLGLKVVDDEIFVLQKQELTQLVDNDGDELIDEYRTICNSWGATSDFHEFAFGLEYKDGFFYAALGLAMRLEDDELQAPDRGTLIKIAKDGTFEPVITGLRQPNGIGFGPENDLYLTDNEGEWLPSGKLIQVIEGQFHGCRHGTGNMYEGVEMTPPTLWLPQNEIGNSPSQPAMIPKGIYQGQMLHGEVTHGGLKRSFLEKIDGVYQGAVFRFTQGLEVGVNRVIIGPDNAIYVGGLGMHGDWGWKGTQHGLQRLEFTDNTTFEILKVQATPSGFNLVFTEPLAENHGENPGDYLVQQWWYQPTQRYGGPKQDLETLSPSSIVVSDDRKSAQLEIPGLKKGGVVYFRLNDELRSSTGQSLWTGEAWYTLNRIPTDQENNI